jgi:aspartate carbamoyltransferase catalytic subunit
MGQQNPKRFRHLTSINDLRIDEIEMLFSLADRYLHELGDPYTPYRIGKSIQLASGSILATLFYEPSTRTRLSFETAMIRLGGKSISSADPATSSAAKGESLADTVRVASNYADVLVIRHPRDGAARFAADFATVPVINGGDGAHEHPTQTLCDLFTLKKENKNLKNLNVAISGDLKGSRTIHSFVYALARFGAGITLLPAKGMDLPEHVYWRLRHEYKCTPERPAGNAESELDALYVTADRPHQLALIAAPDAIDDHLKKDATRTKKAIDAVYVTRFQRERWTEKDQDYPTVDADFLKGKEFSHSSVMHPLPRVGELDVSFDNDPRAVYFRQAAYGVPIRMALVSLLLNLSKEGILAKAGILESFEGGFRSTHHTLYEQPREIGSQCTNPNCIVHDPLDGKYAWNKFHILDGEAPRLRCHYCENDIDVFFVANRRQKTYEAAIQGFHLPKNPADTIFFTSEKSAQEAHYVSRVRRSAMRR